MKHLRIGRQLVLGSVSLLALWLAGCSVLEPKADNTKFYVLRPGSSVGAPADQAVNMDKVVRIGPGRVAAYLDVTPIVVRDGPNRVRRLDNHHWAEPLPKGIQRVLADDLTRHLSHTRVVLYPEPVSGPVLEAHYAVSRFDEDSGGQIVLEVAWQLIESQSGKAVYATSSTIRVKGSSSRSISDYVGAMSEAIDNLAKEMAVGIESQ